MTLSFKSVSAQSQLIKITTSGLRKNRSTLSTLQMPRPTANATHPCFHLLLVYLLTARGLRCRERGLLSRPLIAVASRRVEGRLAGMRASGAAAHRPSCPAARGVCPDQGLSLRPLRWQAILNHWTSREVQYTHFYWYSQG